MLNFLSELKLILKSHTILFFSVLSLIIITGFIQASSLFGIMPIVEFAINGNLNDGNNVIQYISNFFLKMNFDINLLSLCFFYFSIIILKIIFTLTTSYFSNILSFTIYKNLIDRQLSFLLKSKWSHMSNVDHGILANSILKESEKANIGFDAVVSGISNIFTILTYFVVAFYISIELTLSILTLSSILYFLPSYFIGKLIYKIMLIHTNSTNLIQKKIFEMLKGIKVIFSYNKTSDYQRSFNIEFNKILKSGLQFNMIRIFNFQILEPISIFIVILSIYFGKYIFLLSNTDIFLFLFVIYKSVGIKSVLIGDFNRIKGSQPPIEQINTIISNAAKNIDKRDKGKKILKFKNIKFKDVYFRYNKNNEYILKSLNFTIHSNQKVAFVGPSGAGKSTLIDLIIGLLKPSKGKIFINNYDNFFSDSSWLDVIGYVPQNSFLFNASIKDNLLWSNPKCTYEEMVSACKDAYALDFINNTSFGFDTIIGDNGNRFSGGQLQRLCLARALIKKPQILILDEATSALDSESELKIKKSLDSLKLKLTLIVITHKLNTILDSDKIFIVDDNKIIKQGSYKELSADKENILNNLIKKNNEFKD